MTIITLLALVIFGSFVSLMTHMLSRFAVLTGQRDMQFALLRRFLSQNEISTTLSSRVVHAAHYAVTQKKSRIAENEVKMFETISVPLCTEVRNEVFSPILMRHPLFLELKSKDDMALQSVCYFALSEVRLSAGDLLFTEGDLPQHPRMLFIRDGNLIYNSEGRHKFRHIEPGDWLSEMTLWLRHWVHLGALCATTYCTVVALDAQHFQQTIAKFNMAARLMKKYARELAFKIGELERSNPQRESTNLQLIDDVDTMLDIDSIVAGLGSPGSAEAYQEHITSEWEKA